jgi:hypothetical protein
MALAIAKGVTVYIRALQYVKLYLVTVFRQNLNGFKIK